MPIQMIPTSSLEKVFPDRMPHSSHMRLSMLRNDVLSFQLALRPVNIPDTRLEVSVRVDSPIAKYISLRRVELVPSMLPVNDTRDGNILSDQPGLYPDLLTPLPDGKSFLPCRFWTSFWVEIETDDRAVPGIHPVTVTFLPVSGQTEPVCFHTEVEIIDAALPEQELMVTQWFHGDCVADYYQIPVFSETHWEYMRRQILLGARRGLNMILTPIFTPPLDTEVGKERTTIQLVDIFYENGIYSFGFEKLERWVTMCRECGIRYFEMAHLYTQWGAAHCPKVMVWEKGVLRKRFGWEQDALGKDYRVFLQAFLPALIEELKRLGIDRKTIFHISDEPDESCLGQYRAAREQAAALLQDFPLMDAMSHYRFFADGVCNTPIIATSAVTPFLEGECPKELWVYYCCAQGYLVSNRFFGMPSARNRIIGLQFYKYRVKGFLQWGFNFYNSRLSRRHIDPFRVTDADMAFPSGDSFLVYPGEKGEPLSSLRMEVFYEAINDLRALLLLEKLTSREHVMELLEGGLEAPITFSEYPSESAWLLTLRQRVNEEIRFFCGQNGRF